MRSSTKTIVSSASRAWKALNGVFCVYKPAGLHVQGVRKVIIGNLIRDLNEMDVRPPIDFIKIEGSECEGGPLTVTSVPSYADHPLVVGPRHQPQDVRLLWGTSLGRYTSGVFVLGVNDGCGMMHRLRRAQFVRSYEIKCQFGLGTHNCMATGIVREKTTYDNVTQSKLDRVLASIQASHQVEAYKHAGVSAHSETGYELACKGLIRPVGKTGTMIYGVRCTEFDLPYFTLEVQCINESEQYLRQMVHDIGLELKSTAVCAQIRQVRYGNFTIKHALLQKHWNLENILNNIHLCRELADFKSTPSTPQLIAVSNEASQTISQ